jgi:hypothetical protein
MADQTIYQQSTLNKSRKDKFLLVFTLPPILRNYNTNDLSVREQGLVNQNSVQFSVYGSVIPQISVPEVTAGYSGQNYKASSNNRPPYDNISVNFTVDNQFNNYWMLYTWLNLLNDEEQSLYDANQIVPDQSIVKKSGTLNPKLQPQAYQTDLTVYGKDEFDKNIIKFTYTKAFPVSLGSIDYNYRDPGEMETTFEFAFSQFFASLI